MVLTTKEIAKIQCFKIGVCCTHTPCSVYQEENLIRGSLCPSGKAVPEITCISFGFHKVSNICISNGTVSTKIYDKRDDFDFDIVNFPFLDGDVPRCNSYGVYISQLIRFARVSSNLNDFNYRNKALTAKLLRQGYRYFKLLKAFSKFYRRHSALLEKYSVRLKTLLQQGISKPEFYGDLVYRFRKIVGKSNFSEQFRKLINRYKRIGYSLDIMRQTACLVVNPIIVDGYASLFNCTTAVRASDSMTVSS